MEIALKPVDKKTLREIVAVFQKIDGYIMVYGRQGYEWRSLFAHDCGLRTGQGWRNISSWAYRAEVAEEVLPRFPQEDSPEQWAALKRLQDLLELRGAKGTPWPFEMHEWMRQAAFKTDTKSFDEFLTHSAYGSGFSFTDRARAYVRENICSQEESDALPSLSVATFKTREAARLALTETMRQRVLALWQGYVNGLESARHAA